MIAKEQIAQLRELLAAATPGPWGVQSSTADGRLIVAAVNTLPELLDALEQSKRLADKAALDTIDYGRVTADRDRFKERAEALERAMYKDCDYCDHVACKMPCGCINYNGWRFNEARYADGV